MGAWDVAEKIRKMRPVRLVGAADAYASLMVLESVLRRLGRLSDGGAEAVAVGAEFGEHSRVSVC